MLCWVWNHARARFRTHVIPPPPLPVFPSRDQTNASIVSFLDGVCAVVYNSFEMALRRFGSLPLRCVLVVAAGGVDDSSALSPPSRSQPLSFLAFARARTPAVRILTHVAGRGATIAREAYGIDDGLPEQQRLVFLLVEGSLLPLLACSHVPLVYDAGQVFFFSPPCAMEVLLSKCVRLGWGDG